jgi:hypothetical protein
MTKSLPTTNITKLRHELAVMKKELKQFGSPRTFVDKINDVEVAIQRLEKFRAR